MRHDDLVVVSTIEDIKNLCNRQGDYELEVTLHRAKVYREHNIYTSFGIKKRGRKFSLQMNFWKNGELLEEGIIEVFEKLDFVISRIRAKQTTFFSLCKEMIEAAV